MVSFIKDMQTSDIFQDMSKLLSTKSPDVAIVILNFTLVHIDKFSLSWYEHNIQ